MLLNSVSIGALASQPGDGGGEPTFDYIIASDSDWDAIPSELLAGGGTVGIEPGVYSSRTLQDIRPSAPLVFQATDPDDMPVLMRFTGYDLWNVEFHDVDRVSDAWGPNPAPAWAWSASSGKGNGNIRFVGGRVRGNWRGDIDFPFDPTADYPEYANIVPQFAAGGAVSSLVIRNAVVGSYTPDGEENGTYVNALNFTGGASGNGITFSVQPDTTIVVEDGVIVSATVQDGGASTGTPAMNNNWGILSKVIVWDGQIRLFDVMAQGERVITPSGGNARDIFTGPMEWRDVEWSLLVGGSRGSIADTGSIHFIGNHFDLIYGDSIAYGASANATSAPGVTIEYNTFTRPFSSPRDPSDPHSDPIQLWFAVNDNAFDWPVLVRGNVVWIGEARGTVQGVFIADPPVSGDFGYTGYIYGNLVLNADLPNGMSLEQGRDMYIADNTVVRYSPGDPVNGSNTVITGLGRSGSKVLGHSFFGSNISEGFTTGTNIIDDGTVESAGFSNVVLGRAGMSIPYTDVFADPSGDRDTFQQVLAAYTPKAGYANKGAVGRYIDFANRTADLAQQVVFVGLPDIVGQEPSTSVTSGWKKIIGGAESGPISITGGEYQFADDANGSNATTPTSDPGVYLRDKFIQVVQTTSSGESITTTATVSLNGYLNAFNATTKSNAEYPVVAFDGADRFKRNGVLGTDGRYLTLAFKMRFPSDPPAANLPIFTGLNASEGAGVGAVQMIILPTGALRIAVFNAAGSVICQLNSAGGDWCDGQVHEVLIDIDMEQAVAGDGRALWIDGVNRLSATGAWSGGPGVVAGYSRSVGISGYAIGGGSALMLPAGVEMEYIYVNIDERAGVNDSAVRARFDASIIGPDGSGVTGNQPHTFVTGTAAQWNDPAGINWGSDGKYIAASGSAVTDVSGEPWP